MNAVGNNINQIAHIANAERHISADKIEEVLKMQDEIMRLVRSVR
ncbi:MAG: plasmid mobilization relaxosome protein MobC [Ruminococcus sp.]